MKTGKFAKFYLQTGLVLLLGSAIASAHQQTTSNVPDNAMSGNTEVTFAADQSAGTYTVRSTAFSTDVLTSRFGAKVNRRWLYSTAYPKHGTLDSSFTNEFGAGKQITLISSGLARQPDLLCLLRVYSDHPFAEIEVRVRN